MDNYQEETAAWRAEMEQSLRQENGWLALAGLFWLNEGENSIGRGAGNDVMLPAGPERLGKIEIETGDRGIWFRVDEAAEEVLINGEEVQQAALKPDMSGEPTWVTAGSLAFIIIQRGTSYALRLWDNERPEREAFSGRSWFPIDPTYRVQGHYVRFTEAETVMLPRSQGADAEAQMAGEVAFELDGRLFTLLAQENMPNVLFLIFKDETSGKGTYKAGRFLYADVAADGSVIVDFNRAYSPPCAFTDFATCPFPPRENHLSLGIEAGEKYTS